MFLRKLFECGRPCPEEQVAKHRRTRRVRMNVADMTESEMTLYLNHEWDGYVDADEYVNGTSAEENAFDEYTNAVSAYKASAAEVPQRLTGQRRTPPTEDASHGQQLDTHEAAPQPGVTVAAEAQGGACRDASVGELCYQAVTWARAVGILERPGWYTGVNKHSTFKEFQAYLHKERGSLCSMPCPDAAAVEQEPPREEPVLELQPAAEEETKATVGEPAPQTEVAAEEAAAEERAPQPEAATAEEDEASSEPLPLLAKEEPLPGALPVQVSLEPLPLVAQQDIDVSIFEPAKQPENATEEAASTAQQRQAEAVQVNSTEEEPAPQPVAAKVEEEEVASLEPLPWLTEEEPLQQLLSVPLPLVVVEEPLPGALPGQVAGQVNDVSIFEPAKQPDNATEEAASTAQQRQAEAVQVNSTEEEPAPQPELKLEPLPLVETLPLVAQEMAQEVSLEPLPLVAPQVNDVSIFEPAQQPENAAEQPEVKDRGMIEVVGG